MPRALGDTPRPRSSTSGVAVGLVVGNIGILAGSLVSGLLGAGVLWPGCAVTEASTAAAVASRP
ncbi:MAG: hypothetical protein M3N68_03130 [Actinomycetota bacterium]|nr:hypothetical protein [Actinomycetota bacterium]